MGETTPDRTELFIRYIRRSLYLSLGLLALVGLWLVQAAFDTAGIFTPLAQHLVTPFPLLPLLICFAVIANASSLKGQGFNPKDPDVRAVLDDELRHHAFHRATRFAFVLTLLAQLPLALLFQLCPVHASPLYMGALSLVLGPIFLLAAFLVFDRA
jgi:hypothetical protein